MTEKTVNYTEEMVARLHEVYDGEASDEVRREQIAALADEVGKSAASVRAKLTSEGIYVPYAKASKTAAAPRKADIVKAIAEKMNANEEVIESLEKATKVALTKVLNALS